MIINHFNINYSNFIYRKPKYIEENNYYISKIRYRYNGQKKPFLTQTPIITIKNIKKYKDHYTIDINMNNNKFYNLIHNVDKLNLKAVVNSKNWFPGSIKKTISELYIHPIKSSINDEPLLQLRIPIINGSIQCDIFKKNNVTSINQIRSGVEVIAIIELKGIIFKQNGFYPLWDIVKLTICDDEMRCLFENGSDDVIYSDIETDTIAI